MPMIHAPAHDLESTDYAVITTGPMRGTHVVVDRVEGNTAMVYPLGMGDAGRDIKQITKFALARC